MYACSTIVTIVTIYIIECKFIGENKMKPLICI